MPQDEYRLAMRYRNGDCEASGGGGDCRRCYVWDYATEESEIEEGLHEEDRDRGAGWLSGLGRCLATGRSMVRVPLR